MSHEVLVDAAKWSIVSNKKLSIFLPESTSVLTLTLFLSAVLWAGRLGRCMHAKQSTTRSCPSSPGPSLRTVSHQQRGKREECGLVFVEKQTINVKREGRPWEVAGLKRASSLDWMSSLVERCCFTPSQVWWSCRRKEKGALELHDDTFPWIHSANYILFHLFGVFLSSTWL